MTLADMFLSGAWTQIQVTGQNPPGCGGHLLAFVNEHMLLMGGTDRSVTPCTDVFLLNRGSCGSWSALAMETTVNVKCDPYRPFKLIRTGASSVVINEYAYVFGGQEPSTGMCCNDVLQFNARTMHWTMVDVKSGQPPPRHAHTCSKIGQHSFVVFGGASQNHEALNDVWVFNTMTLEWKHVVPGGAAVAGREMAAGTAVSEHQFVVTGGRGGDGVLLDDVVLLDFSGEPTWTQLLRHDSIRRCAHSAVCIHLHKAKGDRLQKIVAVFGGFVGSGLSQELVCYFAKDKL